MRLWSGLTNVEELREFPDRILKVGDEKLGGPNNGKVTIDIHEDLLIKDVSDLMATLVDCTYIGIREGLIDNSYFHDRAILAPINKIVDKVNEHAMCYHVFQEKRGYTWV